MSGVHKYFADLWPRMTLRQKALACYYFYRSKFADWISWRLHRRYERMGRRGRG